MTPWQRFRANPFDTRLGWILLIACATLAAVAGRSVLVQEDFGMYNAALSSPGTLGSATLTQAQADVATACGTKCALWLTSGHWSLTTDHTLTSPLIVPYGTTVSIADGKVLTLARCPKIDAPGWLQPGTTGKVQITAMGCSIDVHKYATGGVGTSADPWTGWEVQLSVVGTCTPVCEWYSSQHYVFGAGFFRVTRPINVPGGLSWFTGAGARLTTISYVPAADIIAGAQTNRYVFKIGGSGEAFSGHVKGIKLTSPDSTTVGKLGLWLVDADEFTVDDFRIAGGWGDPSCLSTGIYFQGRDNSFVTNCSLSTDIPLRLGGSPNLSPPNLDHNTFTQMELFVNAGCKTAGMLIDADAFLTRNQFTNTNISLGAYGVYWPSTAAASSQNNVFDGLSWEQQTQLIAGDATNPANWGYTFYHNPTNLLSQGLIIRNVSTGGAGNGIFIRKTQGVFLDTYRFIGGTGTTPTAPIALNIAGTASPFTAVYPVTCINCWAQDGSVMDIGSYTVVSHKSQQGFYGMNGAFGGYALFIIDAPTSTSPDGVVLPWTPLLLGTTTNESQQPTYTKQVGWTLKNGRQVYYYAYIKVNVHNASATGSLYLAPTFGDPVATSSDPGTGATAATTFYPCTVNRITGFTLNTGAGYNQLAAYVPYVNNTIFFPQIGSNTAPYLTAVGAIADGAEIEVSCIYLTD